MKMTPAKLATISKQSQKKYKRAMVMFTTTGKVTKWLVYGNRYFLWLHHYLSEGKLNVKNGIVKVPKKK